MIRYLQQFYQLQIKFMIPSSPLRSSGMVERCDEHYLINFRNKMFI